MKWMHKYKIKYQLYIFFFIFCFILISLFSFVFIKLWNNFYDDTLKKIKSYNEQICQNIDLKFSPILLNIQDISTNEDLVDYIEKGDLQKSNDVLNQLSSSLLDTNVGKLSCIKIIKGSSRYIDTNVSIDDIFKHDLNASINNIYFSPVYRNNRNEFVFSFYNKIDTNTQNTYYIQLDIYETEIYSFIHYSDYDTNIFYNNFLLSSTDRNLIKNSSKHYFRQNNDNYLISKSNLGFYCQTDVQKNNFKDLFFNNYTVICITILVTIMLTVFFLYTIISYINSRFNILKEKIQLLGDWNFTKQIEIEGNDEFSDLSIQIDKNRYKIWSLLQEINSINKLKRHAEIKALRSQINFHFLFNSLSTIKWLAKTGQFFLIEESVGHLSTFLYYSLSIQEDTVPLKKEIEQLTAYINLQKLKYLNEIYFNIEIDEDMMEFKTTKIILQPLVENCIYHARRNDGSCLNIVIYGYYDEKQYYLVIEDDGCGISEEDIQAIYNKTIKPKNNGYGLQNIIDRIKFVNNGSIEIESVVDEYTKITISQPIDNC